MQQYAISKYPSFISFPGGFILRVSERIGVQVEKKNVDALLRIIRGTFGKASKLALSPGKGEEEKS